MAALLLRQCASSLWRRERCQKLHPRARPCVRLGKEAAYGPQTYSQPANVSLISLSWKPLSQRHCVRVFPAAKDHVRVQPIGGPPARGPPGQTANVLGAVLRQRDRAQGHWLSGKDIKGEVPNNWAPPCLSLARTRSLTRCARAVLSARTAFWWCPRTSRHASIALW